MLIPTSPHRPAPTPWGRLVALVVILGPVSVLVLLPIGLGLQRYIMAGETMAGDRDDSIPRGAVVLERLVPVSDLRVGDVVTYRPPASEVSPGAPDGLVTHRIVEIAPDGIRTQGDAAPLPDPWVLRPNQSVLPRVDFTIPYLGYAYLALANPYLWVVAISATGLALLLVIRASRRAKRVPPDRARADAVAEQ